MDILTGAYDGGTHVKNEKVGYEAVKGIKISFQEKGNWKWRRCCIDGLIVGVEEGGWMEVKMVDAGDEAVDVVLYT
jgi:hypothetical protein